MSVVVVLMLSAGSAAVATTGEPAADLPPGLGVKLLEVPTDRAEDPRANAFIIDHVVPGATVERRIRVSNGTDGDLPVKMLPSAARIEDGWVLDSSNPPGSVATWMTIEPSSFTLRPQSATEVIATIRVPGGTPPGERYGAVVAEQPAVASSGVDLVSRVGIRVYLSVGGDEPETDFEIDTLTASRTTESVPQVEVGVLNTGGRAIDVAGTLQLQSADGAVSAGPFPTVIPKTLAPKSRDSVFVELPESIASGPWDVTATMRSGLVERVAEATITFPEPGETADPAESETIGGTDADGNDISDEIRNQRRILLPLAVILILLAIAALLLLLMWKRREDDEDEDDEDEPAVAGARSAAGEDEGS